MRRLTFLMIFSWLQACIHGAPVLSPHISKHRASPQGVLVCAIWSQPVLDLSAMSVLDLQHLTALKAMRDGLNDGKVPLLEPSVDGTVVLIESAAVFDGQAAYVTLAYVTREITLDADDDAIKAWAKMRVMGLLGTQN